jgi:hypothetical protein
MLPFSRLSRSAAFPLAAPGMVAGHSAAAVPPTAKATRVTVARICHPRVTDRIAATTMALSITVANHSDDAKVSHAPITTNVVQPIAQAICAAAQATQQIPVTSERWCLGLSRLPTLFRKLGHDDV